LLFLPIPGALSADQYPFTDLTQYSYTNTWMSGTDTNKLIFSSGIDNPSGMRIFETIVKKQTDETYNRAWHYGAGWVIGGASGILPVRGFLLCRYAMPSLPQNRYGSTACMKFIDG